MAAGPAKSERKKIKNQVLEDLLWAYANDRADRNLKTWNSKWSWLVTEYEDLHKKCAEVTKKSELLHNVKGNEAEPDLRDIKPTPQTTNGFYGWISTRPDFALDGYGPDVYTAPPLPEQYVLDTKPE